MNADGTCQSGYLKCGNPTSRSKGICLPPKYKSCPLTDITMEQKQNYRQVPFTSFNLFVSNDPSANPIDKLRIAENHMCFIGSTYPLTPGRSKYGLLVGDFDGCHKDL